MTLDEVKQAIKNAKEAGRGRDLHNALAQTISLESALTPEQLQRMGEEIDNEVDKWL